MSDVLLWLGGNGAFNTAGKWNNLTTGQNPSLTAPGSLDFAIVTGTDGQIITGPGSAGFLEVIADTTFTGSIAVSGVNETPTDNLTAFQVRNFKTATFGTGSTLTLTNENAVIGFSQAGHLVLQGGADMSIDVTDVTASMYIGVAAAGSSVLVDGAGTTLTVDAGIHVAATSNASLTVSNGALLTMGAENEFGFYVGVNNGTTGTFNLNTGADVTNTGFTNIGRSSGSTGTVIVEDAGTTWQDVSIAIGFDGMGSLTLRDQATITTVALTLGTVTGTGTLTVQDAGSVLSVTDDMAIGGALVDGGSGGVTVQNSGLIDVANSLVIWGDGTLTTLTGGTVDVGTPGAPVAGALNIESDGLVEGTGTINAPIVNNGILQATDFNVVLSDTTLNIAGAITGTGTIKLQGDATLEINGTVAATQTVLFDNIFAGSDPTLNILAAGAAGFSAVIDGFETGDRIRLANTVAAQALFNSLTNVLTVKDFLGATVASLTLTDLNDANTFVAFTDGVNGTIIKIDDGTNSAPQFTNNGGGAVANISVVEERPASTVVATLTRADADNTIPVYQIIGGADQAKFTLVPGNDDGLSGLLRFATAPDFETPADANTDNVYEVIVAVSDNAGGFDTQTLLITVANAPNPLIGTSAADNLIGTSEAETIIGLGGNDTLSGFANTDILTGGMGRDIMSGGADHDVFDFNSIKETGKTAGTRDRITDFTHNVDDIDLRTIDAKVGSGNQNFKFIAAQTFHHKAGELHYKFSGANTLVEGDTNGDGKADFQIELTGHKVLTAGDFIL